MSVKATTEQPCCTITCGQQVASWRDVIMGMAELGGAAISFGSFYFAQNNVLGGGSAVVTVLTGIVHWRWRNDAHGKPTEGGKKELKEVSVHGSKEDEKEKATDEVVYQAHRLSSNEADLVNGLGKLALLKLRFSETSKDLESKIQMFEDKKKELKDKNKELLKSNKDLKDQISAFKTIITEIRGIHGHYQQHTGELKALFDLESSRLQAGDRTDRTEPGEEEAIIPIRPRQPGHSRKTTHTEKPAIKEKAHFDDGDKTDEMESEKETIISIHTRRTSHPKKPVVEEVEDATESV